MNFGHETMSSDTHKLAPASQPSIEVYESFAIKVHHNTISSGSDAQFGHCIFSALHLPTDVSEAYATVIQHTQRKEDHQGKSSVELQLILSKEKSATENFVPIGHSPSCPARLIHSTHYQSLKQSMPARDLRVGVCCVIEHEGKILITRRSARLRTFPLKWVFPGGHVNLGETLEEAARREVLEETGLYVTNLKQFAFWESCFPTYLETGVPTAHHLVVYYLASLDMTHYTSSAAALGAEALRLQIEECDAAAWISKDVARACIIDGNPNVAFESIVVVPSDDASSAGAAANSVASFTIAQLLGTDNKAAKFESLALGTAFVLKTWLQN